MYTSDYSDDASTFGDRVASAREALGISQADLAQRLGVRSKTVRDWEQDRAEPRSNRLQMLAGLLNVSINRPASICNRLQMLAGLLNVSIMWLMSGQGQGLEPQAEDGSADAVQADLLGELRAIKDDQIALARRLARAERKLRALQ